MRRHCCRTWGFPQSTYAMQRKNRHKLTTTKPCVKIEAHHLPFTIARLSQLPSPLPAFHHSLSPLEVVTEPLVQSNTFYKKQTPHKVQQWLRLKALKRAACPAAADEWFVWFEPSTIASFIHSPMQDKAALTWPGAVSQMQH